MHGQDLAREIEERKGDRPSPGTIYPALKLLKKDGLIKEKKERTMIMYSLTSQGKHALARAKKQFSNTFKGII